MSPYWDDITRALHRALGDLDRTPGSFREGSFHREAWLYRFGGDFHPATRQCAVYPLARLWSETGAGNPYSGSDAIRRYLGSALSFTSRSQNRDGSFPEWYPGQPAFCATAYLSAYLSEILRFPGTPLSPSVRGETLSALERSVAWMAGTRDACPGNQAAASLLAMHNAAALLGTGWKTAADRAAERLLGSRSGEGWSPEHGGADPGYESLTLDFLTRCSDRGVDGLEGAIRAGLRFLDRTVFPDGSCPPSLCRRGTGFLVPYAAERWAVADASARSLAAKIRRGVAEGRLPTPATADGRYSAHFFLPSFVDAHFCRSPLAECSEEPAYPYRLEEGGFRFFRAGSFRVHVREGGGGVAIYSDRLRRTVWGGHGYTLRSRRALFTPFLDGEGNSPEDGGMEWEAAFRSVTEGRRAARTFFAFAGIIGPAGFAASRVEEAIRDRAFRPGDAGPARLHRRVELLPEGVRVKDAVRAAGDFRGTELRALPGAVPSNQPSSRMFSTLELAAPPALSDAASEAIGAAWRLRGAVDVEIDFTSAEGTDRYLCRVDGREVAGGEVDAGLLR